MAASVVAALLDAWLRPPVILFGVVIAALLLLHWRGIGGPWLYHLIGAAAIVVASASPLAGVGHSRAAAAVFLVLGTVYVAIGALDHRHLAATVRFPREAT